MAPLPHSDVQRRLLLSLIPRGAQKGRGCLEQIITLRLLTYYAKRKKKKLFLLFVDFQKAYDKVPRRKLFEGLRERGWGGVMLHSIEALYQDTKFCLGSAIDIDSSVGVRQEDGKMPSMMKHQLEACRKHVNKFAAFVQKNSNMPFTFKHKVLTAALSASMLYSCESWLTDNTSGVNKLYMAAMKMLLGVRTTTPTLCQI
ncbi:hypothetical protein CAPTEDRAFT_216177 [Capitella teleta]|uniref:Uncharacterized protein n=1 Tax=Capitella teleta TaxID=283909 RepID=R7UB42_CAPTE|nr:hypothetical protein CAPTEDRAFT_216177 [Capitella teleta]|eukprot:ELU00462.1 hypothetical protein CAPTEDRAFT_216177 [Capitella teleta]